jgi:hypothetical protein
MRGVLIEPVSLNPGPGVDEGVGIGVGVGVEVGLVLSEGAGVLLAVDDPVAEFPEQPAMARATSRPTRPRLVVRETGGRPSRAGPMPLQGMHVAVRGRIDIF